MKPQETKDLLTLLSVLFVIVLVMMSANQYGPSILVLIFISTLLALVMGGMTLLNLGEYYDQLAEKAQFPGFDSDNSVSAKIQDIVLRVVVTMIIIAFCVRSGIFQASNLNPMKMFM